MVLPDAALRGPDAAAGLNGWRPDRALLRALPRWRARRRSRNLHGGRLPLYPIAVDPLFAAQRMMVQRSHFTLHGRDQRGLDQDQMRELRLAGKLLKVVIDVKGDDVALMRYQLNVLGITQTTIFPDLENLALELKKDYKLE